MGAEHAPDTVWQAQELYCVDRLSFAKVSDIVKVSATTLKAWSKKFDWAKKREEIAQIEAEIRMDTIRSRKKALNMLLESGDGKECSQMAFAVSSLENLALKQQEVIAQGRIAYIQENTPKTKVENRKDAIEALGQAVENKLSFALQNPEALSSATIQDVKKMLDIMQELTASLPSEDDTKKTSQGLSQDMVEALRTALNLD